MAETKDNLLSIEIPMNFRRRGWKKLIVSPDGNPVTPMTQDTINSTLLKAIARAFRWQKLLENGHYSCLNDIAIAEKMDLSRVGKLARLTFLAPDIIESIVEKRQPEDLMLQQLIGPFPIDWEAQRKLFGFK